MSNKSSPPSRLWGGVTRRVTHSTWTRARSLTNVARTASSIVLRSIAWWLSPPFSRADGAGSGHSGPENPDFNYEKWVIASISSMKTDITWIKRLLIPLILGLLYVGLRVTFHT